MIFSGVTILQGVEFPIFPIDFCVGPTTVSAATESKIYARLPF